MRFLQILTRLRLRIESTISFHYIFDSRNSKDTPRFTDDRISQTSMMFRHTRHTAHHLRRLHHTEPMKIAPLLLPLLTPINAFAPQKTILPSRSFSSSSLLAMPICIVVEAEIKEDRMEEFLDLIEKNAVASRQEPGCIRFGE